LRRVHCIGLRAAADRHVARAVTFEARDRLLEESGGGGGEVAGPDRATTLKKKKIPQIWRCIGSLEPDSGNEPSRALVRDPLGVRCHDAWADLKSKTVKTSQRLFGVAAASAMDDRSWPLCFPPAQAPATSVPRGTSHRGHEDLTCLG
jgi:hypothetical protein